jgi:hypothetical protein
MKIIVTSIWLTFFWYLVFCFISMSMYPADWGFMTRGIFAVIVSLTCGILFLFNQAVKNN